ncbi:HIT domain-containing protein [Bacillus sp. 165]
MVYCGETAGQTVFHCHIHLIQDTKVMSISLGVE